MLEELASKPVIVQSAKVLVCAFLAILFTQSGLDKVFDWKGNLDYVKSQFEKTVLKPTVLPMLAVLTVLETATGLLSAAGAVQLLFDPAGKIGLLGILLSGASFLALLFGQRMAKDYAGAAVLPAYYLVALFGLLMYMH